LVLLLSLAVALFGLPPLPPPLPPLLFMPRLPVLVLPPLVLTPIGMAPVVPLLL